MELTSDHGALVARLDVPAAAEGPLSGLTFAVKDLIDVQGTVTGCGTPDWRDSQTPAASHAVAVDILRHAGAAVMGKSVTDEMAFSLIGENYHYGTPLNPTAPDHVPGGSSSGSASAVAQGICDFALGTDTGGSVRVPASNCGIYGLRSGHGRISVAGVQPLAPSFDTVGLFARCPEVLRLATAALLPGPSAELRRLLVPAEILELVQPEVASAFQRALPWPAETVRLGHLLGEPVDLFEWSRTYIQIQCAEIWSCLGGWITARRPRFGPAIQAQFERTARRGRAGVGEAIARRERWAAALTVALPPGTAFCFPTVPGPAPLRGSMGKDPTLDSYYPAALGMNAVAGFGRLPQLSLPLARAGGLPVGISLVGGPGQEHGLLGAL